MTVSILIIADLHLSPERPDITECFSRFLHEQQNQHQALYILGDLFEAWVGDDDLNEFTLTVASLIAKFADKTPVYFIHGNRDFLLGKRYAKRCNMQLLPESVVISKFGRNILLMHGDQLCIDDVDYQKFRSKSRTWWWKALMLALPLKMRRNKADQYRKQSIEQQKHKSQDIMDVNTAEVTKLMAKHHCEWLIHGHTHRPKIHNLEGEKIRAVVGDWYTQGSVLTLSKEKLELSCLPFNTSSNNL